MRRHRFLLLLSTLLVWCFFSAAVRSQEKNEPLERIAFGSCASEDQPQPIWKAVIETQPDLFLFIGDNIYGDTEEMKEMKAKYKKLAAQKGYQDLCKACPVLATWDDHDYGVNDGGKEYPKRKESQQVFLDFFDVPKDSPRRTREGIYHAEMFGPPDKRVQIILLDTRYFRDPLKTRNDVHPGEGPYVANSSPDVTILGEAQWKWLEEQLRKPAKLRLIASSIQVVPEDHGWEKWMNMPLERERLFRLIRDTKAEGVIFLSGDRHLAELSMMDGKVGYPLYDLTSSGLNRGFEGWRKLEENRHRVATMPFGNNFGLIQIDWDQPDPLIRLQIRDEEGDLTIQHKIPLSVLTIGTIPSEGSSGVKLARWNPLTKDVIKENLNQEVIIEMKVQSIGMHKQKGYLFLNSAKNFFDENNFTVLVKKSAQEQMKDQGITELRDHFADKTITATGILALYQGRPELIVEQAKQIRIVEE